MFLYTLHSAAAKPYTTGYCGCQKLTGLQKGILQIKRMKTH